MNGVEAIAHIDAGGMVTGPAVGVGFVVALHPIKGGYFAFNRETGDNYSVGHKVNLWLFGTDIWQSVEGWLKYV